MRSTKRSPSPTSSAPSAAQVAEDLVVYMPPPTVGVREDWRDVVLVHNPSPHPVLGHASRIRFASDGFDERREAVRAWFGGHGRERFTWRLGPSTTPADTRDRLAAAGCVPLEQEPRLDAMVTTEPPPPGPAGADVRPVETYDDFCAFTDLVAEAFEFDDAQRAAAVETREARWAGRAADISTTYLAYIDDVPAAFGVAFFTPHGALLMGGGVTPAARGRGLFRALVRARWDEAVRRGTPILLVQAGKMSEPILARLGFRSVATIDVLVDSTE
jgi:GNAT superfamily N-acetyltransferase